MYACVCLDLMYKIFKLEMIKVQECALLKISLKLFMFYNFANNSKNAVGSFYLGLKNKTTVEN